MPCILVADDDPHILEYLEHVLSDEGYDVMTCDGGEKALEIASHCQPDLIVLDAMMPRLDGFQVLWHLRDRPRTRNIPTIMLTARTGAQDVEYGRKLGAQEYLQKPFIMEDMLACVSSLLGRRAKNGKKFGANRA